MENNNITYSEKLKDPRWQKKRLRIMDRDNFKCRLCGHTKTSLQVHHLKYTGKYPWDCDDSDLVTLCEHCHFEIEVFTIALKQKQLEIQFDKIRVFKRLFDNGSRYMVISIPGSIHHHHYDRNGNALSRVSISEYFTYLEITDLYHNSFDGK